MCLDLLMGWFYVLGSLWGRPQACTSNLAVAAVTAFVDVNVVPMDTERVLSGQTVLIEHGRIIALGPSNKIVVPTDAVRVDGRGKYLIPGLAGRRRL